MTIKKNTAPKKSVLNTLDKQLQKDKVPVEEGNAPKKFASIPDSDHMAAGNN